MIDGIHHLRPIQLVMKDVGPFATAEPIVLTFSGPPEDAAEAPLDGGIDEAVVGFEMRRSPRPPDAAKRRRPLPNFSLLRDSSGNGMSTALDCTFALFDLLSATGAQQERAASRIGLRPTSEVQLDLRLTCSDGNNRIEAILSIWIGGQSPAVRWVDLLAREGAYEARVWASIRFDPVTLEASEGTNDLGRGVLEAVRGEERRSSPVADDHSSLPISALGTMPSALLFGRGTMDRTEGYAPARGFALEPMENHAVLCERLRAMPSSSRDAFLQELSKAVLDAEMPSDACFILDVQAGTLAISLAERQHSLAILDRSERALLTLHSAVMLHNGPAPIILIDGIDGHCQPEELGYLYDSLAYIVSRNRSATMIVASATQHAVMAFVTHPFRADVTIGGCIASGAR